MKYREATLPELRDYFAMEARELMEEWKVLDADTRKWFKVELGKFLQLK